MNNNELNQKIKTRTKRILNKGMLTNLLLLIPPVILEGFIIITAVTTYFLSIALTYFVLPMFYTVEKRIRNNISGIGDQKFSYLDGYKAFFTTSQGGIFGVITSFFMAVVIALLFYLALSFTFPFLCNTFPEATTVYKTIEEMSSSSGTTTYNELYTYVIENGYALTRPLTVLIGTILFVPLFSLIFLSVNSHLVDHYLISIVLPDIDLNISASQGRAIAKTSLRRSINGEYYSFNIKYNWPYYLAFTLIYAISLYLFTFITTTNTMLVPFIVLGAPSIAFVVGYILNYFVLSNSYAIIEEISPLLLDRLPLPMKTSIYQTYCNPNYIHGQESAFRGCFVPQPTYREAHPFSSPFGENPFTSNPFRPRNSERPYETEGSYTTKEETTSQENPANENTTTMKPPAGVVIDLSNKDNTSGEGKDETQK